MRFPALVFSLLLPSALLYLSCEKKDIQVSEEEDVVVPIETEEPIVLESFVKGKILSKKADLCLFGRDLAMHPVLKLSAGADVSVLELDGLIDTKFISEKTAGKFSSEGEKQTNDSLKMSENSDYIEQIPLNGKEYVHVVHDNMDFWLESSVFALNCENAVVVEKTFLYSDEALSQKIDSPQNPLKFASLIAKSKESVSDENLSDLQKNSKSTKIFYYDNEAKSVREAYVSSSSISSRNDDIVVSQIAEELKVTKRAVPRNELFARAAKYKPGKKVLAVLNAQKEDKVVNNYQEVLKSMQKMSFGVNVDELLTVDQSKDPFK